MSEWVQWLSNNSPPYTTYRALNVGRELASNKETGVRPIVCGEIWTRLMRACTQAQTNYCDKVSCSAEQLCDGLECGIEGFLNAMHEVWPEIDM